MWAQSWENALETLEKMFGYKQLFARDLAAEITQMPKMTDSEESLLQGWVLMNRVYSQLENCSLNQQELQLLFFVAIVEPKLSTRSLQEWLKIKERKERVSAFQSSPLPIFFWQWKKL